MSLLLNRIVFVTALAAFTGFDPTLAAAAESKAAEGKAAENSSADKSPTVAKAGETKAAEKKIADKKVKEEYVYVTVTGSNIPKKIKKSDIAAGKLPKDVQMQLMDKEQLRNLHSAPMKGN